MNNILSLIYQIFPRFQWVLHPHLTSWKPEWLYACLKLSIPPKKWWGWAQGIISQEYLEEIKKPNVMKPALKVRFSHIQLSAPLETVSMFWNTLHVNSLPPPVCKAKHWFTKAKILFLSKKLLPVRGQLADFHKIVWHCSHNIYSI